MRLSHVELGCVMLDTVQGLVFNAIYIVLETPRFGASCRPDSTKSTYDFSTI